MLKQKSALCIFALSFCLFVQFSSAQSSVPFPKSVINYMATREMRYHHYLWHQVRENWNRYPESTKQAFRNIGWAPPRAARNFDSSGSSSAILDNNSGEDFLYMHRQMIKTVNDIITKNKEPYGKIKGWTRLPAPGDREFPVPPAYTIPGNPSLTSSTNNRKTNDYYNRNILPNEKLFKDPAKLRQMTLGEFGARIEVTVHGYLHMRFSSANSVGYRNSYKGTIPYIDKKWDVPAYDWLGDSYGSHVHPLFWKIHGWVDDRIEDWRKANGLSTIRWKGTWTGGPMSNLSSVLKKETGLRPVEGEEDDVGNVMEEALQLVLTSGVEEVNFGDDVRVTPFYKMHPRICKKKVM